MAQNDEDGTPMTDEEKPRTRLQRQGEETLGKLAQDLLENPFVTNALSRAFDAREKASQAQEVAMGALNLPSASDLERLTRRLRAVAQRLEGIEDGLDRVEERMDDLSASSKLDGRLSGVEKQLAALVSEVSELRKRLPDDAEAPPREQERMPVDAGS